MKPDQIYLTLRRLFAAAICASCLIATSVSSGQQNDKKQQENGTAAKMKSVPRTPVDRDIEDEESALSAPRADVIASATVRQNKAGQVLRVDGEVPVQGASSARDAADKFLNQNADKLGVAPLVRSRDNDTGLRVVGEIQSLTGTHLTYKQFYDNLPVFDEEMKISVDKKLRVTNVAHDIKPVPASRDLETKPNNQAAAVKAALAAVEGKINEGETPKAELGIVMRKQGDPVTVYSVSFGTTSPAAEWVVMINARSLAVLSVRNVAQYATASAKVFMPNPVNSSGDSAMGDRNNADYPQIGGQMKIVTLRDLDASNTLAGTYANTLPTKGFARAKRAANGYVYPRSDARFDEVMAYYWVTEASNYVRTLGFTAVLKRPLGINVNGTTDDNSFYSPLAKQLTFGTGGIHDAQDASIILHEFGHALLDAQVPGFGGRASESGAISEGFGDYLAASYFGGTGARGTVWDAYVGTWDAVAYNPGNPAFQRRLDGTKTYAQLDADMEVHNNGEIWSSHLWEIRRLLGKKAADQLIIESHFKLSPNATFRQNAEAIIKTDGELNAGRNQTALRGIFTRRGILSSASTATTGGGTTTTGAAAMTNQKWTGKDGLQITYNYRFLTANKASVSVYISSANKTYTDDAATYTMTGKQIEISIFEGMFVQTGTIQGNQITGRSVVDLDKRSANAKQQEDLQKSLSKVDKADAYTWTASRSN